MNVKSSYIIFFGLSLFLGAQVSFSVPEIPSLSNLIVNKVVFPENWKSWGKELIKNKEVLPKDIYEKFFIDRVYTDISFIGFPLKGVEFKNCTFIRVNFQGMDLSETTFNGCKFTSSRIDGVKLKGGWTFYDKIPHLDLIEKYSSLVEAIDRYKDEKEIVQFYTDVAQVFNELIFKVVHMRFIYLNLSNYNLRGICLEKAWFHTVTLRKVEGAQFHNCHFFNVNFKGADLTTTCFNKELNYSLNFFNFKNVLLYKGLRFNNRLSNIALICFYSKLMTINEQIDPEAVHKAKALNKIIGALQFDLSGKNLSGLVLRGIDLSRANLSNTNLTNTDLTDANLTRANLDGALLQGVKLSQFLRLSYSSLSDLFQQWIDSEGENKKGYQKLIFSGLFFIGKILKEEVKRFFNHRDKTQPLDLKYASFGYIDLEGIDFEGVDLSYANFYSTNLENAKFRGAKLEGTKFLSAKLMQADFRGVDIQKINIVTCQLTGTVFSATLTIDPDNPTQLFKIWIGTEGRDKKICQSIIHQEDPLFIKEYYGFNRVPNEDLKNYFNYRDPTVLLDLNGANLNEAQLQGVDLSNVNLSYADLRNANLTQTNFKGANLTHANLDNSIFNKTDFTDANLSEAKINHFILIENEINLNGSYLQKIKYEIDEKFSDFPNYRYLNELFSIWTHGKQYLKRGVQKVVNSRVNIFKGVPHRKLIDYFNNRDIAPCLDLSHSNFAGVDLHGIHFKGANFKDANLSKTDLRHTDFTGADLSGADLRGARLSDTYTVPDDTQDEDLHEHYRSDYDSLDKETKRALEMILVAKGIVSL